MFWQCLAMSPDGTKLLAGVWPGRLYFSTDSGATWTERQPAGDADRYWESATMSADGKAIAVTDGTVLYTSTNAGVNWTTRQPAG